jgi:hypothetical protein
LEVLENKNLTKILEGYIKENVNLFINCWTIVILLPQLPK